MHRSHTIQHTGWITAALFVGLVTGAFAHCEIPCGIYGDTARFDTLEEHYQTIEKSMQRITSIQGAAEKNQHDATRWTINKERHADEVQHIITQYFMTQRIKPEQADYEKKLTLLHKMLVTAMKCKQSVDTTHVATLRTLTAEFRTLYLGAAQ